MTIITWEVISSVWNLASEFIVNFLLHAIRLRDCIVSCAHISLIAEGGTCEDCPPGTGQPQNLFSSILKAILLLGRKFRLAFPRVLQPEGSAGGFSSKWKRINRKARRDGLTWWPSDSFISLLT